MKYIILMGLPASGKTTWAENYKKVNKKYKYGIYIMNLDDYINYDNLTLKEAVEKGIRNKPYYGHIQEIIIDGLLLTNNSIIDVISCLDLYKNDDIEIHYWNENREQCLINDEYRREESSETSIKNMEFEKPNKEYVKPKEISFKIIYHDVYVKEKWQIFADKYNLNLKDCQYIISDHWSNGGTWRNCWGKSGNCSAESPCNFDELDNLLSDCSPSITSIQYKKIWNECVDIDEYSKNDYYGGREYFSYYRCDIENLYNTLITMNLINE